MARSATTLDSFSAIAAPRRREVLGLLAERERPVNDIVESLGWSQPQVSKHLSVLLQVGLVNMSREGPGGEQGLGIYSQPDSISLDAITGARLFCFPAEAGTGS